MAPQEKLTPRAMAGVFPNVSLAMCPLKGSLTPAPYLLHFGAGSVGNEDQKCVGYVRYAF